MFFCCRTCRLRRLRHHRSHDALVQFMFLLLLASHLLLVTVSSFTPLSPISHSFQGGRRAKAATTCHTTSWLPPASTTISSSITTKHQQQRQQYQQRRHHGKVTFLLSSSSPSNAPPPQQQSNDSTDSSPTASSPSSSSSFSSTDELPANLRRKVSAKRPLLGHVVPKANRIQQPQQQQRASGGSSQPELRLQGRMAGRRNTKMASNQFLSSSSSSSSPSPSATSSSLLRIMGGIQKGRRLDSPQFVYLRPMMSKVKEAVFSTLTSLGIYGGDDVRASYYDRDNNHNNHNININCRHLDLFAGSGSVGLESLSRGATHCTFCDLADDCCQTIQRNLIKCQWWDHRPSYISDTNNNNDKTTTKVTTTVVKANVMDLLNDPSSYDLTLPYSVITICPPYEEVVYGDLLEAVVNSPLVAEDSIVVVEYPTELQSLPHVISSSGDGGGGGGGATKKLIGIRNRRYGRTVIAMYICNPTGQLEQATSRPEEFVMPK